MNTTLHFAVRGMSCAACSARVEKAVSSSAGILDASVNLLANSMSVLYDGAVFASDDEAASAVMQAVVQAGYSAELQNAHSEERAKTASANGSMSGNHGADSIAAEQAAALKKRFIVSLCFLLPLMYVAMYSMLPLPIPSIVLRMFDGTPNSITFAFTQFLLLLPILAVNASYFTGGFRNIAHLRPNMDSLIALGSSAAVVYGVWTLLRMGAALGHGDFSAVAHFRHDLYFESAASILTFVTLGKWLEAKSKGKTGDAIAKLVNLSPKTAIVERNGSEIEISAAEVVAGDTVISKPGSRIPADGTVISGSASVDESALTGESMPVFKEVNSHVSAASIVAQGTLRIRVSAAGEDTAFSRIIALVEEAAASKAPIAKAADTAALYFVPTVMFISLVTCIVWLVCGASFSQALSSAIAVLVVSCPCALGLATPVAVMVGTGKGAENGILIKSGEALETLHRIDTVVLDKTGTITEGKPAVSDVVVFEESGMSQNDFLRIVSALERPSEHPLAQAVCRFASDESSSGGGTCAVSADVASCANVLTAEQFENIPGKGVQAVIAGERYMAGNLPFFGDVPSQYLAYMERFAAEGKTPILAAKKNGNTVHFLGIIALADKIRETSQDAVQSFQKEGIRVIMLTGDNEKTAAYIAQKAGIRDCIAGVLPHEKAQTINRLQNEGSCVAMIGDGINDAPALTHADCGIAVGAGTDVAIESADIILVRNDLRDAFRALKLGKAVIRTIRQNLFWAFFYNAAGIPLAAGALYPLLGWKLNPMFAAAAMGLSSVCVVSNALRLRFFTIKDHKQKEKNMTRKVSIKIDGMACAHCSGRVESALNALDGVKATVDLEKKTAFVEVTGTVSNEKLGETVSACGYTVVSVQ